MASEQVLALYDAEKETMVSSDASSFGRSVQKQPFGEMRTVAYAIRESLAIIWALEQ